jgi:hypothetical protein
MRIGVTGAMMALALVAGACTQSSALLSSEDANPLEPYFTGELPPDGLTCRL